MTCASCVGRVERALQAVPDVTSANVNLATEQATAEGTADVAALIAAVAETGYTAHEVAQDASEDEAKAARKDAEQALLKRDLGLAAAFALPVFVLEMGSHVIPGMHALIGSTIGHGTSWLLQFALTTFVLALPGMRFHTKGIPALLRGAPDMNSLVAVGTLAAYLYSVVATFAPDVLPKGTVKGLLLWVMLGPPPRYPYYESLARFFS
ncbi:cation transporter [Ruegeria marisflavi]